MIDKHMLKAQIETVVSDSDFIYNYGRLGERSINHVAILTMSVLLMNENINLILELLEEKFA